MTVFNFNSMEDIPISLQLATPFMLSGDTKAHCFNCNLTHNKFHQIIKRKIQDGMVFTETSVKCKAGCNKILFHKYDSDKSSFGNHVKIYIVYEIKFGEETL